MTKNDALRTLALGLADMATFVGEDVTQEQADEWMTAIRVIDPTDSETAAILRDALRDNCNVIV